VLNYLPAQPPGGELLVLEPERLGGHGRAFGSWPKKAWKNIVKPFIVKKGAVYERKSGTGLE
jgi:hypothetical protein